MAREIEFFLVPKLKEIATFGGHLPFICPKRSLFPFTPVPFLPFRRSWVLIPFSVFFVHYTNMWSMGCYLRVLHTKNVCCRPCQPVAHPPVPYLRPPSAPSSATNRTWVMYMIVSKCRNVDGSTIQMCL